MNIRFSPKSINDINKIYRYLYENFGERVADEKRERIHDDIDMLENNPFLGRSIDGHDQNLRQLTSYYPTVIIYDINDLVVEILHIVDGRTDYKNNLLI